MESNPPVEYFACKSSSSTGLKAVLPDRIGPFGRLVRVSPVAGQCQVYISASLLDQVLPIMS